MLIWLLRLVVYHSRDISKWFHLFLPRVTCVTLDAHQLQSPTRNWLMHGYGSKMIELWPRLPRLQVDMVTLLCGHKLILEFRPPALHITSCFPASCRNPEDCLFSGHSFLQRPSTIGRRVKKFLSWSKFITSNGPSWYFRHLQCSKLKQEIVFQSLVTWRLMLNWYDLGICVE